MGRRILFLSDFSFTGSGYSTIATSLCSGLAELGDEVKAVGLGYKGEEHTFPFGLIPCDSYPDARAIIQNLWFLWKPEILVVALDIPVQIDVLQALSELRQNGLKYIGITPLENGPLSQKWALGLFPADHIFFISELGMQEARKRGLSNTDHLRIGINTKAWHPMSPEERAAARKVLGFTEEEILILTVADNQERKNLWASIVACAKFSDLVGAKVKYLIVTKENAKFGWDLREIAEDENFGDSLVIFERGMPIEQLSVLYNISDAFLLLSKAEGLGLPVLEAFACGLPVVCTNTGAMPELVGKDESRGYLVDVAYDFIDVWGNSRRAMADIYHATTQLIKALSDENASEKINNARRYAESRNEMFPVMQLHDKIEEVINGKE